MLPERFKVAFSFAGEQRDRVREIATAVQQHLGPNSVFFDEWYEHYIAGNDADLKLQDIYKQRCVLAVVCVAERYGDKPWTQAEHAAIRARSMQASVSQNEVEKLSVLPIRVGDGEVPGILLNAIVPDVREKTTQETVELILKRLALILPEMAAAAQGKVWPQQPLPYEHGLADRIEQWPVIQNLMTADSALRILLLKGASGHSKSALLGAAESYARSLGIATAYVDFKNSQLLQQANVLQRLQLDLEGALPNSDNFSPWGLLEALRHLTQPVLIVLDTYEKTAETRDLAEWIETQWLTEVARCPLLRFLIGGQCVPNRHNHVRWRSCADELELGRIDDQQAWKEWIQRQNPGVTEQHIESIVLGMQGIPSTISTTLAIFAQAKAATESLIP